MKIVMHYGANPYRETSLCEVRQQLADIADGTVKHQTFILSTQTEEWDEEAAHPSARYLVVAWWSAKQGQKAGWLAEFGDIPGTPFALAADARTDAPMIDGEAFGKRFQIRANCVVSAELVLRAAETYITKYDRDRRLHWLPSVETCVSTNDNLHHKV
ncbi:hypothetical protein [Fimbriiglobus ruber]|uniref:hypothetical protein n=1 Tax=Fimbriiglobus ruber TaxID=1908690 RepID=UPI000B4B34D0|nr:hypothetical protein [Fimbriiglobus ruber]